MDFTQREILETIRMTELEHLDIRTVTMGINLSDCAARTSADVASAVHEKIVAKAGRLVATVREIGEEFGIRVANNRVSDTPIATAGDACRDHDYTAIARAVDQAAHDIGVDFIGGFSALVHKGTTRAEDIFLASIPEALASTARLS